MRTVLLLTTAFSAVPASAFLSPARHSCFPLATRPSTATVAATDDDAGWTNLTDDGAVRIRTIEAAPDGEIPSPGDEVSMDYVGTLAERSWTAQDVVEAWLPEQQGLAGLADGFISDNIDGDALAFLTEDYVRDNLGVENRIQCKKLVMAARRLEKEDMAAGAEFDSSKERGPYTFPLGEGKVIRATDLAVASMRHGETARMVARCDYAYGKDGLRRSNGDVVVPPFATLCFNITLLEKDQ